MMKTLMNNHLQNGEKIVWSGVPRNVKLIESLFIPGLIGRWAGSAALLIFCVWYSSYAAKMDVGSQAHNIVIICAVVAVMFAIMPFLNLNKLKTQCAYYITNQRAVLLISMNKTCFIKSRMLDEVGDLSFDSLSTGCGIVYIGEKTRRAQKLSRHQSINSGMSDTDLPLMFYSVEDPIAVCNILRAQIKRGSEKMAG